MTYTQRVSEASEPKAAMLHLAAGIDEILSVLGEHGKEDPWGTWSDDTPQPEHAAIAIRIHDVDEDTRVVEIPRVDEAQHETRRLFEQQQLRLSTILGSADDWTEAYVKGGALWLYNGNRDLVMSYPYATRQALVNDVIEAGMPQAAHEMARDVLKLPAETGPGAPAMGVDLMGASPTPPRGAG